MGDLRASWGGLGPVLGRQGELKMLIFAVFFTTFGKTNVLSKHVLLGRSSAFLETFLGPFGVILGPHGAILGRLGVIFGGLG